MDHLAPLISYTCGKRINGGSGFCGLLERLTRSATIYKQLELFYLQIPAFVFHGIVPCVAITSSEYFHGSKGNCNSRALEVLLV
ncbi:hypothetical protein [uncultured Dysgonomonas sp.]|uniref:hypothetical protein n=1 Tax=uncultured Dysgonomonas sp. TaxID=206096 RepID=UPI002609F96D|nr:hypothetical protein [uncultured Dysgonomonas sp.]